MVALNVPPATSNDMRKQTRDGIAIVLAMLHVKGREWSENFAGAVDGFVGNGSLPSDPDQLELMRAVTSIGMGMVCGGMDAVIEAGKALKP